MVVLGVIEEGLQRRLVLDNVLTQLEHVITEGLGVNLTAGREHTRVAHVLQTGSDEPSVGVLRRSRDSHGLSVIEDDSRVNRQLSQPSTNRHLGIFHPTSDKSLHSFLLALMHRSSIQQPSLRYSFHLQTPSISHIIYLPILCPHTHSPTYPPTSLPSVLISTSLPPHPPAHSSLPPPPHH